MKSGTPNLLKFKRLQRQLGTSKSSTVGHLELLWLEACANCPEGDVGRFSNEEIAIMVDWAGDPDLLVESAVNSGWLDSCEVHRLLIHDWHEHCPNFVKGFMAKHGRQFARQSTRQPAKQPTRQDAKQGALHAATLPNQTNTLPDQSNNGRAHPKRPTLEEVTEYCVERDSSVDPQYFLDWQEANGWKLSNGNPLKSWQAAIRNWEHRDAKVVRLPQYNEFGDLMG